MVSMTHEDLSRPVKEFRSGAVHATVWQRGYRDPDNHNAPSYAVRIARRYLTEEKTFGDSPYFADDELPMVVAVAQAAYAWLHVHQPDAVRPGSAAPAPDRPESVCAGSAP